MFDYYDDDDGDDEEDYEIGIHDPIDLHQLMMMQRPMPLQPRHGEGSTTFIKRWSTRRSSGDVPSFKRSQSKVSAKIAPFFNMKENHFADLVICNGSRRLYAHQLVVASWSDVLKQNIVAERTKWTFLENGVMPLTDHVHIELKIEDNEDTAIALENVFGFMYTETVELSLKTVWAHIRLAIHYKVDELLVVCMKFIHSQLSVVPIRPFIVDVMNEAKSRAFTSTVVELAMLRIQSELFFEEAEVVSSFDVDFLCDVLRGSDVVAKSEYDIFQKLKPKLAELMNTGERRKVQRLLGLLRLTQMKTSELTELSSSEYMDVMREAFPEKLESALWSRALFSEQGFHEMPISLEMPRLYLEIPVPYLHEDYGRQYHRDDYEGFSILHIRDFGYEQRKLKSMVFKIKDGEQVADQGTNGSVMPIRRQVPVYRITNGEHAMRKLSEFCQLEIPSGKFDFVTVNYKLPKMTKTTFKLLMVFLIQTQAGSKRKVFAHTDDQIETGVQCPIFPLPISEDCQATVVDAVCYIYENMEHGKRTPRMSWDEALKLHYTTFKAT